MILSALALVLLTFIILWTSYHLPIMLTGIFAARHEGGDVSPSLDRLPTFSLIVPTRNEAKVITRGLRALLGLDYPREKMEILVVDGNSEDGTAEQCRKFVNAYPRTVRLLHEETPKGKPKALNYALPHVTGEIVGVFDADSVPEKNVLKRTVANFADPRVMAVQGRTTSLNKDENMITRVASMEEQSWLQALVNGREKMGLFVPLTGSCQFVRKRVLEELGGWAEDSLAEDVELSLRLVEKNYVVKYASEACSGEETPSQLRRLIQQRTRWYRGYMEEAIRYGRLVKRENLSRRIVDAEVSLVGPFVMVLCLVSYFNWALTRFVFTESLSLLPSLAVVLTSLTVFSIGVAVTLMTKPARLRNLVWIPFIYVYWLLQTMIAGGAFLQMVLRRPKVWRKTVKDGSRTRPSPVRRDPLTISVISSFPPNRGRLSEYGESLVAELAKKRSIGKIRVYADVADGGRTREVGEKVMVDRVWRPDHVPSILGILLHLLRHKPDVAHFNVHFQSFGRKRVPNFVGLSLPLLCRALRIPSVVSIHNLGERVNLKVLGITPSFLNRLGIRVTTKLITLASAVTVTVRSYVEGVRARYRCANLTFVPHGTTVYHGLKAPPVNPHKRVLMFGHMGPSKGLPIILEVAERLGKTHEEFRLVVAGQDHPNFPHYMERFKDIAPPNVEFRGYIPEDRLPELFQSAYLVVLPYLTATGTSGVFHLTCGFGKPIIASNLPETRELVKTGAAALLVPPRDVDGLCKAIISLYDAPETAAEMGRQNLAFASRESMAHVATRFEHVYQQVTHR